MSRSNSSKTRSRKVELVFELIRSQISFSDFVFFAIEICKIFAIDLIPIFFSSVFFFCGDEEKNIEVTMWSRYGEYTSPSTIRTVTTKVE